MGGINCRLCRDDAKKEDAFSLNTEVRDKIKKVNNQGNENTNDVGIALPPEPLEQREDNQKKKDNEIKVICEKEVEKENIMKPVNNFDPVQSSLISNNIVKSLSLEPV